jgi:hypothetical protein
MPSPECYGLSSSYYAPKVNGQMMGAGGDLTVSPVPEPQAWGCSAWLRAASWCRADPDPAHPGEAGVKKATRPGSFLFFEPVQRR